MTDLQKFRDANLVDVMEHLQYANDSLALAYLFDEEIPEERYLLALGYIGTLSDYVRCILMKKDCE